MSTIADELWFTGLPDEDQVRIRRLACAGLIGVPDAGDAEILRAYEVGWDDAMESVRYHTYNCYDKTDDEILREVKL
jgi:hypothetical protein